MADSSSRNDLGRWAILARSLGLLLLVVAPRALAAGVNLAWDPVVNPSLSGYMVYYGPSVGNYPTKIDVGNRTTYTVPGLAVGSTYHFVVTAYDASHIESGYSNDVGTTVPYPDVGLYRKAAGVTKPPYRYILDYNFDHTPDAHIQYGVAGDVPLVGKINPGGKSSLIMYRNGWWNIDTNRDGIADVVMPFGIAGDKPLTANFSGPGQLDDIAIYRAGFWYVDTDLNGTVDQTFVLGGLLGDIPLAGDVNGDGIADLAIYRNGIWYIDTNRNGTVDLTVGFGGMPTDKPLLYDWDGDGKADLCLYRDGTWYVSTQRDGVADVIFIYGTAGDLPMLGKFH